MPLSSRALQGCTSLQRAWAARQPTAPHGRAPVTAGAGPRASRRGSQDANTAARSARLEASTAAAQPCGTPTPAAGLNVQPQAEQQSGEDEASTSSKPVLQWERVYAGASPMARPKAATAAATAAAAAAPGPAAAAKSVRRWEPTAGAPRPPRRATAAPGTAIGQSGADPRLACLTQQLIQCQGQVEMRVVLEREQEVGLGAADVRRLLTYLERRGAADVALTAFHAMKAAGLPWAGDAVLRTKLMKMHSRRAQDTGVALRLYDEMRRDGIAPDAVTYNTCLTAAGLGHHWPRVLALLEDMRAGGVPWDVYTCSALLSACQVCSKWEQALEWFGQARDMPGLQLNVVHYTTLMSCLQNAGQWEQSMDAFRQMEAAGIVPDVVAHNAAIAACAKGGDWEAAWAVFLAMKQAGLRPSTISYNALISACERCGQPDRALEVFDAMRRRGQAPNAVTFNTLISACAKEGRYAKAQELHAAMAAAGIPDDVFTLTALITACERIDHWQGAEDHFLEFQSRGVRLNTVAYNRLISALGCGAQWERALAAFRAMQAGGEGGAGSSIGGGSSSSSVGGRKGASVGSMDSVSAGSVYASCTTAKPDRITYSSLIAALERGGQWERALALFEEMQVAGIQPNGYIFTSVINACEKGGQWERAVRLFKLMQGQDIPLGSMAMVARKALYAFPPLIRLMPAPLLQAARATVDSGRAARQWIEESKQKREEESS